MDEESYLKVSDKDLCSIIKLCWPLYVGFAIFKLREFLDTASETRYNLSLPKTMDSAQHNFVMK
jgi:hypothetical protein